jgi:hypothetical protein
MQPKEIGPRPSTNTTMGPGGLNAEYAAAFDELVQRKAKETGLDLNALPEPPAGGGRGGGGGGGGRGNTPPAPIAGSSAPKFGEAAPADWNPRFVVGRTQRALDFIQGQRRRYILINQWAAFMKDLDMFIGSSSTDVGVNAQTGHPCAVVPYKFDIPGGGGGRGGNAPAAELKPQPIVANIIGNLYNDDKILSVAHQFQVHDDVVMKHPAL